MGNCLYSESIKYFSCENQCCCTQKVIEAVRIIMNTIETPRAYPAITYHRIDCTMSSK